ncbi:MAG: PKD domain-containing protein [Pseudomonadota bacterium]
MFALAGDAIATDNDAFSPHIVVVVDESGSMRGRHDWIADALAELGHALEQRNMNALPDRVDVTLAGFTTRPRELADRSTFAAASQAARRLRIDGGTEDGYVAIRDILQSYLASNEFSPTTVVLVTDEDRDVTDKNLTFAALSDLLLQNGIVVHAVTKARIVCPDLRNGLAADRNGTAITIGPDGVSDCSAAQVQSVDDYAELAWETGGLVWNLDALARAGDAPASPETLERFATALSDRIIAQWPTGSVWADIDLWPPNPGVGEAVTFDAGRSLSTTPGAQVVSWAWDLDGDGTVDQTGPVVANVYQAPGVYRVVLQVTDDSTPARVGRKVLSLSVTESARR